MASRRRPQPELARPPIELDGAQRADEDQTDEYRDDHGQQHEDRRNEHARQKVRHVIGDPASRLPQDPVNLFPHSYSSSGRG